MKDSANRKRTLITIRAMDKNVRSEGELIKVKEKCHTHNVNYLLLSEMDEDSFRRAMSEEFNQIDRFFKK